MHRLLLFLVLSLALNATFAALWWRTGRDAASSPRGDLGSNASATAARDSSIAMSDSEPGGAGAAAVGSPASEADWESIHRELHAAGYPRAIIARVLQTLAGEQLSALYTSVAGTDEQPYWKPRVGGGAAAAERMKEVFRLERETEARMVALLGADYLVELDDQLVHAQMRYGPLPAEKLLRVQAVERDWQEKRAE
ncbi:MAG TPA: hypothetical protein VHF69_02365, partial [Candidatus Synoicihabitans sp.]|nr:hypothetical protein [Candidatus Synoicihabitans sp.]